MAAKAHCRAGSMVIQSDVTTMAWPTSNRAGHQGGRADHFGLPIIVCSGSNSQQPRLEQEHSICQPMRGDLPVWG